jgi:hypothetical protein
VQASDIERGYCRLEDVMEVLVVVVLAAVVVGLGYALVQRRRARR